MSYKKVTVFLLQQDVLRQELTQK